MKYLLDTNVCVDYLTGRFPQVVRQIQDLAPEALCLSSIVIAELRYGADKSAKPRRNHELLDVLINEIPARDFDPAAASIYGRVRATLERKGRPIGPNDMLIAAHALSLGLILVSDNQSEFRRVKDLKLENWREA
ncbi:MAG: type II toxin-antitoxin system tRNA(fMet)-specific endonuclease VapC [Vicinamibacteria bacterium]